MIAALYVDATGPYLSMPGVDAWPESRDARGYPGPHAIVAHPPCADWSRLSGMAKHVPGRRELAPLAVMQVRTFGGVLEHPAWSKLWPELGLPRPGELPDAWGGWSIEVNQVAWGHKAAKPTWLYFVGVERSDVRPLSGGVPTHVIATSTRDADRRLPKLHAKAARLSPPDFAAWLVSLARTVRPGTEPNTNPVSSAGQCGREPRTRNRAVDFRTHDY
jgi:hypothetical protein